MSCAMQKRPCILIVEDEQVVAMDLERSLRQLGYEVAGVADEADEALRLIETADPDLVLMDIQIAGKRDGISLAEEIRSRWEIPVVFATAHTNPETIDRAESAAPFGYLVKPFRLNDLNATLVVALQQHRLAREWFAEHVWLTSLLASLGEGVIATDAKGEVRYMNRAAETLIGWPLAEALGKPIEHVYSLLTLDGVPLKQCQLRRALAERRIKEPQAFLLVGRSGQRIAIEDVAAPILNASGELTGATTLFRDIAERQRGEEERERLVRELERSNQELCRFSYAVSHDLNAPLRNIRSLLELLVRRDEGQLSGEQIDLLRMITRAADNMQCLVHSLLQYAQVGHGAMSRKPVDMNAVIESVRSTFASLLAETKAELCCTSLPVVDADRVQMEQLFQNLIGNAINYRRSGVAPVIIISGETIAGGWQFAVADNGQGVPPDQVDAIFRPLKRLHGSDIPGTGLGLALCRAIVERHGGRICVESPGTAQGATFRFFLPETGTAQGEGT